MRITKQDMRAHVFNSKAWYINWYKNGKRHREDGPSNIWIYGDEYYYLNGKSYFKGKDFYWKEVHENY